MENHNKGQPFTIVTICRRSAFTIIDISEIIGMSKKKQILLPSNDKLCVVMKIRAILIDPDLYHNGTFLIIRQKSLLLLRRPIYSGNINGLYWGNL